MNEHQPATATAEDKPGCAVNGSTAWWTSYKAYALVWYALGLYALYLQQPLGIAGCMMSGTLSIKLSRWQRMP